VMTQNVGVFRTEAGIMAAIETLRELKARAEQTALSGKNPVMNPELIHRWELDNLLDVSMVIARAALDRKESRGAHFREDYPERRNEFNDHTLMMMPSFDRIEARSRPVEMCLFRAGGDHSEQFGWIARKY